MILLIFGGIYAYTSIPSLSVKVASIQSGINASYPEFLPDGYSSDGPVTYDNDTVIINFHANTGNTKFTIKQTKSPLDSTAVKEKVEKSSKGQFLVKEERGLTIFTYNGNGMWVNGGILYTITGDAPLSSDQIRRIAISL